MSNYLLKLVLGGGSDLSCLNLENYVLSSFSLEIHDSPDLCLIRSDSNEITRSFSC